MRSERLRLEETTVTDVVRALCKQSGESMSDIATATGISASTLYCLCNANRHSNQADIILLDKIAKHFGYDITVFLGLDKYEKRITLSDEEKTVIKTIKKLDPVARDAVAAFLKGLSGDFVELSIQVASEALKMNEKGIKRVLETCDDLRSSGKYERD